MPSTDLTFPLTAKKIGPGATALSRPKVYYLNDANLVRVEADTVRNATILKVKNPTQKVELYESPNEFLAAQALAQGATANINAAFNIASAQTASGSTAGAALTITKYFTEVSAGNGLGVILPDPFVRRNCVIINTTTGSINVYASRYSGGGTMAAIDGSTATYVLTSGKRKHFVAPTAATANTTAPWQTARDAG